MTVLLLYVQLERRIRRRAGCRNIPASRSRFGGAHSVTAVVDYVRKLGCTIEDNGANRRGWR